MDLRDRQAPLKARYRDEPGAARITLTARASAQDAPTSCSVDLGRLIDLGHPVRHAAYEIAEITEPTLVGLLAPYLAKWTPA